jgi:hypothetical protein
MWRLIWKGKIGMGREGRNDWGRGWRGREAKLNEIVDNDSQT